MQHFGSNIVEGVAESWVEVEMSWVEADGAGWRWMELGGGGARFNNTLSKIPIIWPKCSIDLKFLFNTPWHHDQCLWLKQMEL